jgi:hypothetical protein
LGGALPDDAGELVRDVGIANHVWSVEEIVGLLDFMKWEKPISFRRFSVLGSVNHIFCFNFQ